MGIEPMPDDSLQAATLQRVDRRLESLYKLIVGNGDVGMAEQIRKNARDIESLKNSLDMVLKDSEDPSVTKARLRLLAEIVVAISALSALFMNLLGG